MINTLPKSLIEAVTRVITPDTHIDVDGNLKHRFNSEGRPIHHTDDGIKNFHRWFGDSKAVDEHGRPHVLYHGTAKDFSEFDTSGGSGKSFGTGAFFTSSKHVANTYSTTGDNTNVMPVYLKIHDPVVVEANGKNWARLNNKTKIHLPKTTVPDQDEHLLASLEDREPNKDAMVTLKKKSTNLGKVFSGELPYDDDFTSTDDVSRWAKKTGYGSVVFKSVRDHGPSGKYSTEQAKDPHDVYVAFHPHQVKSAIGNKGDFSNEKQAIHESVDLANPAIIGRVKDAHDSGRYDLTHTKEDTPYGETHKFYAHAKKPANAVDFSPRQGRPEVAWHDPEISTLHTPNPEDMYSRQHPVLKPDSGYHMNVQDEQKEGVIYRGMSQEEFDNVKKTGQIQSHGQYNLEGQEGLTYYSKDPSQAQSYAHSFAPVHVKATGQHKAYVVAVKDPGTDVKIKGTGENEVGIPHPISTKDILHVHEGRAYAGHPGQYDVHKGWSGYEEGSSVGPTVHVGWKKVGFPV